MTTAMIDLNGQVRLSRTQKGYTWEVVVPVLGIGSAAFLDAVRIALDVIAAWKPSRRTATSSEPTKGATK
jgi:hypothetical protein